MRFKVQFVNYMTFSYKYISFELNVCNSCKIMKVNVDGMTEQGKI